MFKRPRIGYNGAAALIYHYVYHKDIRNPSDKLSCDPEDESDLVATVPEGCEAHQLMRKTRRHIPNCIQKLMNVCKIEEAQAVAKIEDKFNDPRENFVSPQKNMEYITIHMLLQDDDKTIYLRVNNTFLLDLGRTMGDIYKEHKSDDHFLHITYACYETLG